MAAPGGMRRPRTFTNPINPCSMMMGESYFSADGDDDISKTIIEAPKLSWREDPAVTYSDWTIVVETGHNEFDSRTYHVHKSILSVGPRSSKYFSGLFHEQSKHYDGRRNQITKIELDQQDADCFPLFLDFMYDISVDANDDDSLSLVAGDEMNTSNAVSLRHLARTFDCEGLILAVNKFIQKDLSLKTGPVYLTQAYYYQDTRLVESAKRLCVENFHQLKTKSLVRLPLELFRELIHSVHKASTSPRNMEKFEVNTLSLQMSAVVWQYFEHNKSLLTVELLLELTSIDIMPKLAWEPALGLTSLARDLDTSDVDVESEEWKSLVRLFKRCSRSVVKEYDWKEFEIESVLDEYLYGACASDNAKMENLLFASSFGAFLQKAQDDQKNVAVNAGNWKQQLSDLRKENAELKHQSRRVADEVDRYKMVLADTKEELLLMKQQLKEMRKPPAPQPGAFDSCGVR
mmetsp:Transcript_9544/g.27213  ORF Transcript_9544/g.27213 Transcript_9544/m.27213 type:complete len:461 (-) Transcript_9544:218-1600(-)|eukprot:CAMPEP_0119561650 /NCGR_PEP_ID=MMETSP1352-20130426/18257_1 /TAXON_ID=265584 /ORGANISM="Stauroneis constricta, Strain CCMP1120" /LENGTH=460 /DNA_ID=CAMNT_0007609897 /DNA_START=494 /DNA_END=1876 /DNA_ORIENTATION=+